MWLSNSILRPGDWQEMLAWFLTEDAWLAAATEGNPYYEAAETLLHGARPMCIWEAAMGVAFSCLMSVFDVCFLLILPRFPGHLVKRIHS